MPLCLAEHIPLQSLFSSAGHSYLHALLSCPTQFHFIYHHQHHSPPYFIILYLLHIPNLFFPYLQIVCPPLIVSPGLNKPGLFSFRYSFIFSCWGLFPDFHTLLSPCSSHRLPSCFSARISVSQHWSNILQQNFVFCFSIVKYFLCLKIYFCSVLLLLFHHLSVLQSGLVSVSAFLNNLISYDLFS